jgi:tetratricopeptide (TPR) repeat protein
MAISFRHLGQLARAHEYAQRAIAYANESANGPLIALAWLERADLALQAGDPAMAEVSAQRAAVEFGKLPDPIREADALRVVGAARLRLGGLANAQAVLERAEALARAHGSRLVQGETLRVLAECLQARDARRDARDALVTAVTIFDELGATEQRSEAVAWANSVWGHGAIS